MRQCWRPACPIGRIDRSIRNSSRARHPGVNSVAGAQRFPSNAAEETWNNVHQRKSRNFTSSSTSYPQARSKPPGRFFEYLARHQEDDEPYTAAQQERDIEAAAEIDRGKGIPHEDVLRDFGL